MSPKILVTGANGFIGSHLIEHLVTEGFKVKAFVHYNSSGRWTNLSEMPNAIYEACEIVAGDICDSESVSLAVKNCDIVFHLAALIGIPYSYVAPASYVSTNIVGTLNVINACRRHEIKRLVHTSTSEVYGSAQYVPIDEHHPIVGQSPYSATKISADKLVESYCMSFGLPAVIVRPFNTFGPRQSRRAVIPTIITQALAGGIVKLGSVSPVRDLTYVTDTARGFLAAAGCDQAVGGVFNLGVGFGISIIELVEKIGTIIGRKIHILEDCSRVRPSQSEVIRLISDNTKSRQILNWTPEVDIDNGLLLTINHWKKKVLHYDNNNDNDVYVM